MDFSKASFNGQNHVAISLTDACNRRCTYCYVTEKRLTCSNQVNTFLLLSNLERLYNGHHFRLLTILGGEPSLYTNLEKIVESIAKIGFEIIIQTNGTLSPKRIQRISTYNIKGISYSLDSHNKYVNDRLRFSGSFDLVQQGVTFCKEIKLPIRICSVVSKINKSEILSLFNWCNSHGVEVLNIHELDSSVNPSFLDPLVLKPNEWRDFVKSLVAYFKNTDYYTAFRIPIAYLTGIESQLIAKHQLACPAICNDMLYISPQLEVFRCPLLMNNRISFEQLNDALEIEPQDNLRVFPNSARCPLSTKDDIDNSKLVEVCKLVKMTINKQNIVSNTPVWSDILK
jgi:MoaA/NifB/PqqE/SkfB family radical SAM enzyme